MSGIIEIWRKERHAGLPVKFTVGMPPVLPDGGEENDIIVRSIVFRELGTIGKLRVKEGVFCVNFVDSPVQRLIPVSEMVDVAYETKEADAVKTPPLEA